MPTTGLRATAARSLGALARFVRTPGFRVGFLVVAVAAAVVAVSSEWETFSATAARMGSLVLLTSALAAAGNVLLAGLAWRRLLRASGSPLPLGAALQIFLVGQVGKYVPGSVWNVLAQAELASDHGVPRSRTVGASTIGLGMSVAMGALIALPSVALLPSLQGWRWVALATVPAVLVTFQPRVLNWLLARLMTATRRPMPVSVLSARDVVSASWWTLLAWLALGVQVLVLLLAAGAPLGGRTVVAALSGYALAWVVGFVAVFAPAGVGPRELVLTAVLAPLLGTGEALAVVLVARVVSTVVDLLLAGLAALTVRVLPPRVAGRPPIRWRRADTSRH